MMTSSSKLSFSPQVTDLIFNQSVEYAQVSKTLTVNLALYNQNTITNCQSWLNKIHKKLKEYPHLKMHEGHKFALSRSMFILKELATDLSPDYQWKIYSYYPKLFAHILETLHNPCWIDDVMDPDTAECEEHHSCDSELMRILAKTTPKCEDLHDF